MPHEASRSAVADRATKVEPLRARRAVDTVRAVITNLLGRRREGDGTEADPTRNRVRDGPEGGRHRLRRKRVKA
ncbi:hypothetical protein GCM10009832_31330 [Dietzia kunjamensis subsp. schimae]